jgi:hypothetical protein
VKAAKDMTIYDHLQEATRLMDAVEDHMAAVEELATKARNVGHPGGPIALKKARNLRDLVTVAAHEVRAW